MIVINTEFPAEIIFSNGKSGLQDRLPENRYFQITCTVISQIREIFRLVFLDIKKYKKL